MQPQRPAPAKGRPDLGWRIAVDGFAVVPEGLTPVVVGGLLDELSQLPDCQQVRRQGEVYAVRELFSVLPSLAALVCSPAIRALVEPVLGPECFAVRSLLFDKTPRANWKVCWHQDRTIALKRRIDVAGFGPWSRKAGVVHAHAPKAILERMLTLRLHLDDSTALNGPLRVLPGSHRSGCLDWQTVQHWQATETAITCLVPRGGALLMQPLLLHASSAAHLPHHRRVIQIEFAADELPGGLEWRWACKAENSLKEPP
ncbi:phytanoyl-CoA dioxygenase family protein [Gloeobacter kilaueensis]|uniref:phytanoyl-CoA dioxygenase family protein n=1 Tax=Gloeobacter kilaueensis TaxID=1416614 RepID=UPI0003FC2C84|nr:phytanoyl-CoA dioxygenase family protein [Gloeobacter kilaueensis]